MGCGDRFNNMRFMMREEMAKPESVPASGELRVLLEPPTPEDAAAAATAAQLRPEPLSDEAFAGLWTEVVSRETPEDWLFAYYDVLCAVLHFTSNQVCFPSLPTPLPFPHLHHPSRLPSGQCILPRSPNH
jgi:hypothetical protein